MAICPYCGHDNHSFGAYCESCGKQIKAKAASSENKLKGRIGGKTLDAELSTHYDDAKKNERGKLKGKIGARKYELDTKKETAPTAQSSKLKGKIGETEYHYSPDVSGAIDEQKTSEIKGKLKGKVGTSSYVYESRATDVSSERGKERAYRAERMTDTSLKGRVGTRSYNNNKKAVNSKASSGGEPPRRVPQWLWGVFVSAAVLTLIILFVHHNIGTQDHYDLAVVRSSMAEVNQFAQSLTEPDGYISEDQTQYAIDAVCSHAVSMPGVLSCDEDEYGVLIHTESGFDYVYTPPVRDTDNYGTSLKIITCQPYCTENKQNNMGFDLDAPDICANETAATDSRWSFAAADDVDDTDVNMDRILNIDDYKLILWHGHGGYTKKAGYFLCTTIPFTESLLGKYKCITKENSVILLDGTLALKPSFFDETFEKGAFDNAFIYFATCFSGKEEAFARVFINKGAAVVFVNSESINRGYNLDMLHIIVESFFLGVDAPTVRKAINELGTHYSFNAPDMWTVADCLALAKQYYGDKDGTRPIKAAKVYYLGKSNVDNLTYNEWMSYFSTAGDPYIFEIKPTSSPVNTIPPQATKAERQAALLAYAELLHDGVSLDGTVLGKTTEATHYYLFEMDGDGIEEIITYASPHTGEWSFKVFSYKNGRVFQIADSINTCDISEWSNSKITIDISNGVLHANAGKTTAAYTAGSDNYLFFDGNIVRNYRTADSVPPTSVSNSFTLVNGDANYGIRIGSEQDYLSELYLQYHPLPTPSSRTSPLLDGNYYGLLSSWSSDNMTIELLNYEGRHEMSFNYLFSPTGQTLTLDISHAVIMLEWPWCDGDEIKCSTIDDALNTEVWGGSSTLREQCTMEISFVIQNSVVTEIVFLYAA